MGRVNAHLSGGGIHRLWDVDIRPDDSPTLPRVDGSDIVRSAGFNGRIAELGLWLRLEVADLGKGFAIVVRNKDADRRAVWPDATRDGIAAQNNTAIRQRADIHAAVVMRDRDAPQGRPRTAIIS